jgi:hypothetical protein
LSLHNRLKELFLAEVERTGVVRLDPGWIHDLGKADARSSWAVAKGGPKPQGGR